MHDGSIRCVSLTWPPCLTVRCDACPIRSLAFLGSTLPCIAQPQCALWHRQFCKTKSDRPSVVMCLLDPPLARPFDTLRFFDLPLLDGLSPGVSRPLPRVSRPFAPRFLELAFSDLSLPFVSSTRPLWKCTHVSADVCMNFSWGGFCGTAGVLQ